MWEAAATATPLAKGVIDLRRHDKLPAVLLEQADDCLLDLLFGNQVAVTDKHLELLLAGGATARRLAE
ncbi:hypothetical protein ABMA32_00780 [Mesorhizobium sp. VNQ89]|uniref:hypothetical protein n=1 Tax=Mesorhizobium quangtriensis TaxID=3157709 RepID=UPI0032B83821